jgi:hypothetical protein
MNQFRLDTAIVLLATICLANFSADSLVAQIADFDRESLKVKDSLKLKSGSTLYGTIRSEGVGDDGRKFILFESEDGTIMKLDLARTIYRGKVKRINAVDQEYNEWVSKLKDDPNSHWEICDWLEKRPSGSVRFKRQIQFHLERIMELDPNDEKAKIALGFEFIRSEGRWVPKKQYYASLGYEKSGTSWKPKLQNRISAQHEINKSIEGEKKLAFRIWQKEANKKNPNIAALRNELFNICNEPAVPIIFAAARDEKSAVRRSMFIEAIGRVPCTAAQNALCVFAVEEEVIANRERALTLLSSEHFSKEGAVGFLRQYLAAAYQKGKRASSLGARTQIRRAAFAIGQLGSSSAILPLVDAMITEHQVTPGEDPNRQQFEQNNRGEFTFGGGAAPVVQKFRNEEVVKALRKISEEDFGYNAAAWKAWYVHNHTHYDVRARR